MKLSDLTQEGLDVLVERASLLNKTPLASLDNEQARFAIQRTCGGMPVGEAADLAVRFFVLNEEERPLALVKEKAGLKLIDAIGAVMNQAAANRAVGR